MRSQKLNCFKIFAAFASGVLISSIALARPWGEHHMRMNASAARIGQLEEDLKELIKEKKHAEEPAELRVITQNIADKYAEIEKLYKERHTEELHIRFQHPEKGDDEKREYTRVKLKSLEELENDFGLDARLNRVQAQIRRTYGIETQAKDQAAKETTSHLTKHEEAHEDERLPASEGKKKNQIPDADERITLSK